MKRCVLNAVLTVTKVAESRMEAGVLFQVAGAETANECFWKSEEVMCPVAHDANTGEFIWVVSEKNNYPSN